MVSVGAMGCGGPQKTNLAPSANEKTIQNTPDWFLAPPRDPNFIFSVSTATSRDMQMAIEKAKVNSRGELAQSMKERVQTLTKRFAEEVGEGSDSESLDTMSRTIKTVADEALVGVSVEKHHIATESSIYRAWVLLSLPIGDANRQLKAKIQENENLYARFRSTEAFKELDKEIDALRDE
jgi:esterase/lipase superfamily enzyme